MVLLFEQARAALRTLRVFATVLWAGLRLLTILPLLHQVLHALVGQIFVEPFVVNLDHGCVDASAQALDLTQVEQTVSRGLLVINVGKVLDSLDNLVSL